MIQEYLNLQLIQTTDDADFEKLKKTCGDLAKKISKDKGKIVALSLVAFDPGIPADNEEILEVKNLIIENWQTFLSNSKDTMLTVIRAVILEALQIASKDRTNASLIWFTVRNVIRYYKLVGEKEILTKFLLDLGNAIESEASESWNFSPDQSIETPKISPASIDASELPGAAINGATMAEVLNKALKKQVAELKEGQKEFARLNAIMQMRTQLLWWKESAYSPTLGDSYRGIKDGFLQVILAADYSYFIPGIYPVSADYFLLETHKVFCQNSEKRIKISDFLNMVTQFSSELKDIIEEYNGESSRICFANFIQGLIHGKYQTKQFKSLVGLSEGTETTLGELTLWGFHDLHSIKLATT